jgi:hypothetical protein
MHNNNNNLIYKKKKRKLTLARSLLIAVLSKQ